MKILVTGGTGYIGSHTAVELLNAGHEVVLVDNLSNSDKQVVDKIGKICGSTPEFHQADATDENAMEAIFKGHRFDGIIHFAGFKAVGESVAKPLDYYRNNLLSTIVLARVALAHGVERFIFSSSATVYGENPSPMVETMKLLPTTNPYGETKAMSERILTDAAAAAKGWGVTLLRYFNPVGAHPSGLIGENPRGVPNNLLPYVAQTAGDQREFLSIFGNDYDTPDGTGVRDYIHVMDLAAGHLAALEKQKPGVSVYNLGTGAGTSVLQLVQAFEEANGVKVPYRIVDRRPGDLAVCYADASKAEAELGWKASRGVLDMVRDAWNFQTKLKEEEQEKSQSQE